MQFELNHAVEVLEQTPAVLDALLRHKSDAWLKCRKKPDSFSALDVIGHLIHAELTDWMPRVRIILDHLDARPFDPFDRFAFQHLIAGKAIGQLLEEFAALRRQSLNTLRDLRIDPQQLALVGKHPELGRVTLANLLATWVVHDLGHLTQIQKTMANEYRDAVGPWQAYLSILD